MATVKGLLDFSVHSLLMKFSITVIAIYDRLVRFTILCFSFRFWFDFCKPTLRVGTILVAMAPKILQLATSFVASLNQKSWLPNGDQAKALTSRATYMYLFQRVFSTLLYCEIRIQNSLKCTFLIEQRQLQFMRHFVLPGKNAVFQPPIENFQIRSKPCVTYSLSGSQSWQ